MSTPSDVLHALETGKPVFLQFLRGKDADYDDGRHLFVNVALGSPTGTFWITSPEDALGGEHVANALNCASEEQALTPGVYRHFKGGRYRVILVGRYLSEPTRHAVVYISLIYGSTWIRPLNAWQEETDRWSDGVRRPRFVLETPEIAALFPR